MIPAKFDYTRPSSLDEAVSALVFRRRGREGDRGRAVAAAAAPAAVLLPVRSSSTSAGLTSCAASATSAPSLEIGALTTHYELTRDPLIAAHCGLLAEAAGTIADPAVRHRGTIGGALAHADPAGDLPAVVTALDATLVAAGPSGTRTISPADFFTDYLTTLARAPGRSSPRSGCRSWTAGATGTRSSTSPPRPGRSSGSPRSPSDPTGTSARRGSGSPTWARCRSGRAPSRRRRRAQRRRRPRSRPPPPAPTRARTRRATCAARPTTAATSPASSPAAP